MSTQPPTLLTVVLVHGAFADASSWNGVVERLQAAGIQVAAPANPLRGIAIDSAYIASFLEQIPGPVLAVGHSYGGAVISNADRGLERRRPRLRRRLRPRGRRASGRAQGESKDSVLMSTLVPLKYPSGDGGTATEFAIDPEKFRDAFAADLPPEQTAVMAATQRPVAESAFAEPSGPPAWRSGRPGPSSRPATKRPAPMSSARWPSAPARRSPRPTAHT